VSGKQSVCDQQLRHFYFRTPQLAHTRVFVGRFHFRAVCFRRRKLRYARMTGSALISATA
jgi:hypothetical protein